ncbi:MAG: substrate-binding domain-containing protein [Chthoniobacterales bacterium]
MRKRSCIYAMLSSSDFDRCIYEGISTCLLENAPDMEANMELDYLDEDLVHYSKGIITRINKSDEIPHLRAYDIPVINISDVVESPGFPSVISDAVLAGQLAAEHFLSRRFHHFAYYGLLTTHYSAEQSRSFEQAVKEAGDFKCAVKFHSWKSTCNAMTKAERLDLREWITRLPKPVGILCSGDLYAWELSKACDALNFVVGRDVGIMGSGNWEFFCKSRRPQLSSLDNRPDRIGYEAAALLLRMIRGEKAPSSPVLIPPTVIARASSDAFVAGDSYVSGAIQFIHDHITQPLSPQEVFNHIPLSRTALERRFRKQLNYTVLEAIHLLKIDHIKHLLISTSKSIEEIACICGFSSGPYMTTLFREKVGTTPSDYRHRFRGGNAALAKA